jgi:hypothetical protein
MPLYSQKARPFQDKSSRKSRLDSSDSDGSSSGSDSDVKPAKKRVRTAAQAPAKAASSSSILDMEGISSDDDAELDAAAAAAPAQPAAAADSDDFDNEFESFLAAAQAATPQKEDAKTKRERDEHKRLIEAKRAALAYSPVAAAAAEAIDIDAEANVDDAHSISALDDVRLLMLKCRHGKRTLSIKCALSRKLGDIKETACKQLGVEEPSLATFWLNDSAVGEDDDDKTLRQLGIRKEDSPELQVVVAEDSGSGAAADAGPQIAVQLRINGTEKVITATLPCAAPLSALAAHLCSHYKLGGGDAAAIAAAQAGGIAFTFDEEKLALTATAQEAGLEADDLVDAVISAELLSSGKSIAKGDALTVPAAQRPLETGPAVKLKLRVNADTSTRVEVWCRMPLAASFGDLLLAFCEKYKWEQAAAAASIKLVFDGNTLAATAKPPELEMEDEDLVDMTVPVQLLSKGSAVTSNDEVNVYSSAAAAAAAAAPPRSAAAAKKAAPKKPAAAAAKAGAGSSSSSSRPPARRRPGAAAAAKQKDIVCIDSDDDDITAVAAGSSSSSSAAAAPLAAAATLARRGRKPRAAAAASSSASTATSGGASPAGTLSLPPTPLRAPPARSELRLLLALADRAASEPPCPVSVYNDATFRKFVTRFLKAKAVKGTPELSCNGTPLSLDSTLFAAGLAPNDTINITVTRPSAALDLQWVDQVYRYE